MLGSARFAKFNRARGQFPCADPRRVARRSQGISPRGTVLDAADSRQAMRLIEANPDLHLVLLDLNLPDRDGLAVLADLRSHATISLVVLSASEERDSILKAIELGQGRSKPSGASFLKRTATATRHRGRDRARRAPGIRAVRRARRRQLREEEGPSGEAEIGNGCRYRPRLKCAAVRPPRFEISNRSRR
jgi:DNA-binding response OmpR family regulator